MLKQSIRLSIRFYHVFFVGGIFPLYAMILFNLICLVLLGLTLAITESDYSAQLDPSIINSKNEIHGFSWPWPVIKNNDSSQFQIQMSSLEEPELPPFSQGTVDSYSLGSENQSSSMRQLTIKKIINCCLSTMEAAVLGSSDYRPNSYIGRIIILCSGAIGVVTFGIFAGIAVNAIRVAFKETKV